MNYLVPGAYPGEGVGGGSGGTVQTITGGVGIQASLDFLNNVILTNFGLISITGSGDVTVTQGVNGDYTADVPIVATTFNGNPNATLEGDNNGITLVNSILNNTISTNFPDSQSDYDSPPTYNLDGTTLTITLTSQSFYQRANFISYNLDIDDNYITYGPTSYMIIESGSTSVTYFRKTIPLRQPIANQSIFHSGSFFFSTAAPRKVRIQITMYNITATTGIVPIGGKVYSLNLFS